MPLIVLTHGQPVSTQIPAGVTPPDFRWEAVNQVALELQADLASLVPGAQQVIAKESGHYIQLEQPDLVIEAIRQVVVAVRDPETWRSG
jgi:hypothetical protein